MKKLLMLIFWSDMKSAKITNENQPGKKISIKYHSQTTESEADQRN